MAFRMYIEVLNRRWQWELASEQLAVGTPIVGPINVLLYMGPNSPPFAFCGKGMPKKGNISPRLEKVFETVENPKFENYLTRQELQTKAAELFLRQDVDAGGYRTALSQFITKLPAHASDPAYQRIVYWWEGVSAKRKTQQ